MNKILETMKAEAKDMASKLELPGFYRECSRELDYCRAQFFDSPIILRLQEDVIPFLYDDYGHGIYHSKKVAIEASAIILAENRHGDILKAKDLAVLAQVAGLLHDVCRLEEDHALRGAELSESILADYPLSDKDRQRISFAIADHEAFTPRKNTEDTEAELLSAALYDADKFRWGPDNFATTLWEMCDYNDLELEDIIMMFPNGVKKIEEISSTFRTGIGRAFGPEFIELGLILGKDVYRRLNELAAEEAAND